MSLPLFGQLDLRPSARHQMLPQVQARYEDGEIQLHHAAASDFQLCACTLHSFWRLPTSNRSSGAVCVNLRHMRGTCLASQRPDQTAVQPGGCSHAASADTFKTRFTWTKLSGIVCHHTHHRKGTATHEETWTWRLTAKRWCGQIGTLFKHTKKRLRYHCLLEKGCYSICIACMGACKDPSANNHQAPATFSCKVWDLAPFRLH